MFEERYAVLIKLDEVLQDYFHGKDWRELEPKLDSIYRKSYFLFSHESYKFIERFRAEMVNATLLKGSADLYDMNKSKDARDFLRKYSYSQNLSNEFKEMKIDIY